MGAGENISSKINSRWPRRIFSEWRGFTNRHNSWIPLNISCRRNAQGVPEPGRPSQKGRGGGGEKRNRM